VIHGKVRVAACTGCGCVNIFVTVLASITAATFVFVVTIVLLLGCRLRNGLRK
jgi:hypothetical protein